MIEKTTLKISIPKSLVNKLSQRYKKEGFNSLEEYITSLLKEAISEEKEEVSKEDEEKVKERLRALGYLD